MGKAIFDDGEPVSEEAECHPVTDGTTNIQVEEGTDFFDFAINLHSMLCAAHPYLGAMALEYLGSTVLCEKVPYRWQQ